MDGDIDGEIDEVMEHLRLLTSWIVQKTPWISRTITNEGFVPWKLNKEIASERQSQVANDVSSSHSSHRNPTNHLLTQKTIIRDLLGHSGGSINA